MELWKYEPLYNLHKQCLLLFGVIKTSSKTLLVLIKPNIVGSVLIRLFSRAAAATREPFLWPSETFTVLPTVGP